MIQTSHVFSLVISEDEQNIGPCGREAPKEHQGEDEHHSGRERRKSKAVLSPQLQHGRVAG